MGIQSTIEIGREEAVERALKVFAERNREFIECLSNEQLEEMIDEHFYNFRIVKTNYI